MVSDLTPEETLRAEACEAYGYGITVVVPLDVALAAVAAERERLGERLLSDEAVEAVAMTYEPDTFVGDAPHADEALRDARDVLSAAWRVVTGSNHE